MNKSKQSKPHFITRGEFVRTPEYRNWMQALKARFKQSQIKAAMNVNRTALEFYWLLGKDIVEMQAESTWGSGFFNQLSLDLKDLFPEATRFSVTNLKYIKRWYIFYSQCNKIRHQAGDELEMPYELGLVPWRHHAAILTHCKHVDEALFYINEVIQGNWSRRRLEDEIQMALYENKGNAVTNFSVQHPSPQSELAQEVIRDTYQFDFLHLRKGYAERELEDALAHNISRFLLELDRGFAFVGRQMELRMPGGQTFYP